MRGSIRQFRASRKRKTWLATAASFAPTWLATASNTASNLAALARFEEFEGFAGFGGSSREFRASRNRKTWLATASLAAPIAGLARFEGFEGLERFEGFEAFEAFGGSIRQFRASRKKKTWLATAASFAPTWLATASNLAALARFEEFEGFAGFGGSSREFRASRNRKTWLATAALSQEKEPIGLPQPRYWQLQELAWQVLKGLTRLKPLVWLEKERLGLPQPLVWQQMKSTPKVVPGAAPAMAQAGVGGFNVNNLKVRISWGRTGVAVEAFHVAEFPHQLPCHTSPQAGAGSRSVLLSWRPYLGGSFDSVLSTGLEWIFSWISPEIWKATMRAIMEIGSQEADERLVLVVSDADLQRWDMDDMDITRSAFVSVRVRDSPQLSTGTISTCGCSANLKSL